MDRASLALCLSVSLLALGLAGYSLAQRGADSSSEEASTSIEVLETLARVESRLDALENRGEAAPPSRKIRAKSAGLRKSTGQSGDSGEPKGIEETLQTLVDRLDVLEDDETIAKLAQSGAHRVREKQVASALNLVTDREANPEDRIAALRDLRKVFKSKGHHEMIRNLMEERGIEEQDVVLPIMELAKDTTLDPELRVEALSGIGESKIKELRQPLLDILSFDEDIAVRNRAIRSLMSHGHDENVQQAILNISQDDRQPEVQAAAREHMPWITKIARRYTPDSALAQASRANDAARRSDGRAAGK